MKSLSFRFQLGAQLFEIINLAVEHNCVTALGGAHRLMPCRTQILNREASANQTGDAIFRNKLARIVRPAMLKIARKPLKAKFEIVAIKSWVKYSRNPAHV